MHQGGYETQHNESYRWISIGCEPGGARQVHNKGKMSCMCTLPVYMDTLLSCIR